MKDKISIGQVSKYFGIPKQTLRFYEQNGLIHSLRDPQSGYRYYRYEDLNQLFDLITLHQFGFGVPKMKQLLNQGSIKDYNEQLTNRQQGIAAQITKLQLQQQAIGQLITAINTIKKDLGKLSQSHIPTSYFVAMQNYGQQMKSLPADHPIISGQTIKPGCLIQNDATAGLTFNWGLFYDQVVEGSTLISSDAALTTIVDLKDEGQGDQVIEDVLNQAKQEFPSINLKWPLVGQFILRCHQDGQRQRFIRIWLPLSKEE